MFYDNSPGIFIDPYQQPVEYPFIFQSIGFPAHGYVTA
jgi:hypothetical protein